MSLANKYSLMPSKPDKQVRLSRTKYLSYTGCPIINNSLEKLYNSNILGELLLMEIKSILH